MIDNDQFDVALPAAHDNCTCACHHDSNVRHFVACCHPSVEEIQRAMELKQKVREICARHPFSWEKPGEEPVPFNTGNKDHDDFMNALQRGDHLDVLIHPYATD